MILVMWARVVVQIWRPMFKSQCRPYLPIFTLGKVNKYHSLFAKMGIPYPPANRPVKKMYFKVTFSLTFSLEFQEIRRIRFFIIRCCFWLRARDSHRVNPMREADTRFKIFLSHLLLPH